MSLWWSQARLLVLAVLVVAGACAPLRPPEGKSPLRPVSMSPDSCVLDILFVRFPFGDAEANGPLWDELDEQRLPCDVRVRLERNGFRAGVSGGRMPLALARLLELNNKPGPTGECQQVSLEELEPVPTVVRRHLQVRPGQRREILTSDISPEWQVLFCSEQGTYGGSFQDAQGVLALETRLEPSGRVRLDLVPELHYGDRVPRYVGQQHAFRIDTGRSRRVFDDLALSASLAPGEMLVLTAMPNRGGSLGDRFFTHETFGRKEQKLLAIRLSQTQHDDLFGSRSADSSPAADRTDCVREAVGN